MADLGSFSSATTRQERVQRKEGAIVAAARDMFLERGFKGTTMAQIARASGVADGTIYTYFQNKEALARAVITDFYHRLTESAQDGVDALSGAIDRLTFLAKHHLVNITHESGILAMMPLVDMNLDSYEGSTLFGLNKNYVAIFDRVIRDAQAQDIVKPNLDVWVIRDIFFGGLEYGSRTMMVKGRQDSLDQFTANIVSVLLCTEPTSHASPLDNAVTRLENTAARMEKLLKDNAS